MNPVHRTYWKPASQVPCSRISQDAKMKTQKMPQHYFFLSWEIKCVHWEPNHKAECILGYKVKSRYGPIWQAPHEGWGQEGANFRRMTLVVDGKREEVCGSEGYEEGGWGLPEESSPSPETVPSFSVTPLLLCSIRAQFWAMSPKSTVPWRPYLLCRGHWALWFAHYNRYLLSWIEF